MCWLIFSLPFLCISEIRISDLGKTEHIHFSFLLRSVTYESCASLTSWEHRYIAYAEHKDIPVVRLVFILKNPLWKRCKLQENWQSVVNLRKFRVWGEIKVNIVSFFFILSQNACWSKGGIRITWFVSFFFSLVAVYNWRFVKSDSSKWRRNIAPLAGYRCLQNWRYSFLKNTIAYEKITTGGVSPKISVSSFSKVHSTSLSFKVQLTLKY